MQQNNFIMNKTEEIIMEDNKKEVEIETVSINNAKETTEQPVQDEKDKTISDLTDKIAELNGRT